LIKVGISFCHPAIVLAGWRNFSERFYCIGWPFKVHLHARNRSAFLRCVLTPPKRRRTIRCVFQRPKRTRKSDAQMTL